LNNPNKSIESNPEADKKWEGTLESDLCAALIGEMIKIRQDMGISQKQLAELSGVQQPVIARIEKGTAIPQLRTIIKLLVPLGKTLAIVPLENK